MTETECIFFQLTKTSQAAVKFLGQKVASLGITPIQSLILRLLGDSDEVTATVLAKRSELDMATLTGIIDRLEGGGLIERRTNPEDRRSFLICLTDRGRELAKKVEEIIKEANREFTRDLSDEERKWVLSTLIRLRQAG
ncbi:MAG TPA: MarR family transcriptional regulator [Syntrophales bacterium]|nr:MarR family transcriptional regulator [Syntrophales bacterium]HOL59766.1 MarR family transcriptional regulator [Syntrophales bacterium]HPO35924.1 MarR family transcriptional regulator [Syntrophales bacterium]